MEMVYKFFHWSVLKTVLLKPISVFQIWFPLNIWALLVPSPLKHRSKMVVSEYLQTNLSSYWLWPRPSFHLLQIRDLTWASSDCVVQWSTLGSWGETADTADPTSCAVANCHELLATGDNRGKVRLSSHPSCQPRTLAHVYSGHSQQVRNNKQYILILNLNYTTDNCVNLKQAIILLIYSKCIKVPISTVNLFYMFWHVHFIFWNIT